jgi:drug/metabolite transporter (DMT)-like permease
VTARSRAELVLLATTVVWGGTFTVVKLGMEDLSPILLIAVRFSVSAALVVVLAPRCLAGLSRRQILRGALLSLFLFGGFATQNLGLLITTASKSAFITGMMVVVVPILQIALERRAPKIGNVLGVLIVVLGLWLLTSPTGATFNAGDGLTIACAVFLGLYIVYLDMISREMTTSQILLLQTSFTAAYAWIAVLLFETPFWVFTGRSILAMLYLTLLATLGTIAVQSRFQKDTTPTRAVLIFSIEPVFASVIAGLALGERLGTPGIFGGGLIIAGVILSELSDQIPGLKRSLGIPRA